MKKNLVLTLLVVFSTYSLKAQEVFSPYEEPDSAALLDEFGVERALKQRVARIDLDLLDATYRNVSENSISELTLNFFPDESFTAIVNTIHRDSWNRGVVLGGSSIDGDISYTPQRTGKGYAYFSFSRPREFIYYVIMEIEDEVSLIFKFPWGSLFSPYRGVLTPEEFQISGKRYRLVHVNHDQLFSSVKNFQDGKEHYIIFDLFDKNSPIGATIKSTISPEDSPEDYRITLELPPRVQATEDNIFDLDIVDGKVASMEITYNWAESRNYYRIVPFDKVEGVYIITEEEVTERF